MGKENTVNHDLLRSSWYSPKKILDEFEDLREQYPEKIYDSVFKKAREMFVGAVALLGAYELSSDNKYFMQLNTQSTSPDIIAINPTERGKAGVLMEVNQLEITEFENHFLSDDLVTFLRTTKISPKRDYGEHVIIICVVNREILIDSKKINQQLKILKPKSTIYILGRSIDAKTGDFTIFSVWPTLTKILNYNVNLTASKYFLPSRVNLDRGFTEKIFYRESVLKPVTNFEILGLNQREILRKYNY